MPGQTGEKGNPGNDCNVTQISELQQKVEKLEKNNLSLYKEYNGNIIFICLINDLVFLKSIKVIYSLARTLDSIFFLN